MRKAILAALAAPFNALLGIAPGHFGHAKKNMDPGAGTLRRRIREAAYRAEQAERLKNAAPAQVTRQQLRRKAMGRAH